MKNLDDILNTIQEYGAFKGIIKLDEPLAQKSTFKIGGKAAAFIAPENYISFQFILDTLLYFDAKFFIIGGGSNIVFPDDYYDGVILSTQEFAEVNYMAFENLPYSMQSIPVEKDKVLVTCFAGTTVASVVNFCTKNNISGFEQFAGLPGSIGGALYMNARCFDKSISECLFYSSYMDFSEGKAKLKKLVYNPEDFDYKKSPFQNNHSFITTVTLLLSQKTPADHEKIESDCKYYINERVSKGHFKFPSAGSVFKNNHEFGMPSGKLIDEAGLKGFQIGGAKIADFHGNFIINTGNATSKDVKEIVNHTIEIIKQKNGFTLEPEIIFVDDNMSIFDK